MPQELGQNHHWLLRYLDQHCKGLGNAKHREEVLEAARSAGVKSRAGTLLGDSALRIVKEECIEAGYLICATQKDGYWRPTSVEEVRMDAAEKWMRVRDLSAKAKRMQEVAERVFGPQADLPKVPEPAGEKRE